ncbi:alpha/beta fold hydrolase [Nocardia sp. 348MFTsu5.1]|uniref:alpha/beta fold hydrolase n=1 Tax=Nocardia sp. 348MFTsu5.1 TaxID=1172185 RepID=UPI0003652940|nr:alpha/beta fold hydrolase [Nocardia sp. 348MFTsu5.1]
MYDFEDSRQGGESGPPLSKPMFALTALEVLRVAVEFPVSVGFDAVVPQRRLGSGHPVLVLPGFYASDSLTGRLRAHLRKLDYRVHGWGLGSNHGLTDEVVQGLPARLDAIHQRYGRPVSVVGWSFGGLLARWLGHVHSDQIDRVITLGSPWRPEGEITRTTALFERAARKYGLSPDARDIVDVLRQPMPVPCTAIYSKTDGIVNWRSCALDPAENHENIAVTSSHIGLVSNPLALAVVADRLAQDDSAGEPFEWGRCLRRSLFGPSPEHLP